MTAKHVLIIGTAYITFHPTLHLLLTNDRCLLCTEFQKKVSVERTKTLECRGLHHLDSKLMSTGQLPQWYSLCIDRRRSSEAYSKSVSEGIT